MKKFRATEAAFRIVMLSYNLMSLFRQIVLQNKTQATLNSLKFKCFALGSWIVKTGREKVLKISTAGRKRLWLEGLSSKVDQLHPPFYFLMHNLGLLCQSKKTNHYIMKKLSFILALTVLTTLDAISQVVIDPIVLTSIEDTSTRFCFNNTKLMAGDSITNRYLVYYNSDTIFLNVKQGADWTKKIVIVSSNIESATMTLHRDTIWVCWRGGAFIRASYSVNLGNTWTAVPPVSSGGNVSAPSIYASSNGKIHFVWSIATLNDTTVYHRVFFNGSYLTNEKPLSNPTGKGLWPSVIAVGDTVLCAWKEEPPPTKVWFASSFNGGYTWTTPDTTNSNLPVAKDPNLAYAFENSTNTHYLYIAYDSQNKIYLQRSANFGVSWDSPLLISDSNKLSQFAHLECNNKGFVGISYEQRPIGSSLFDDTKKDVGFAYSINWSNSFSVDTLAYTHNDFGSIYPAFNKIDENNFYLVWLTKDTINNKINVLERLIHFSNTAGINTYEQNRSSQIHIFPNPFSTQSTLQVNTSLNNASIIIYNLIGQQVMKIKNIYGKTAAFSRNNIPSGFYFIQLTQNNKVIATEKIIIID